MVFIILNKERKRFIWEWDLNSGLTILKKISSIHLESLNQSNNLVNGYSMLKFIPSFLNFYVDI